MPSDLVHNERIKYLATFTNTVGAAAVAAGAIAPLVAFSYGVPGPVSGGLAIAISLAWLLIGMLLHMAVRTILRRLRG